MRLHLVEFGAPHASAGPHDIAARPTPGTGAEGSGGGGAMMPGVLPEHGDVYDSPEMAIGVMRPIAIAGVGLLAHADEVKGVEQTFHIEEREAGGTPVISVQGEIDVATAPQLRESIHGVIAKGSRTVVLDLLGVTFLDSTALGVLVGGLKRCRELGGEFHIVVADARIKKIFEITGLDNVFPMAETVESVEVASS